MQKIQVWLIHYPGSVIPKPFNISELVFVATATLFAVNLTFAFAVAKSPEYSPLNPAQLN